MCRGCEQTGIRYGFLPAFEQGGESRVEPEGPKGVEETVEEREEAECGVEFSVISVFGRVSRP
jgi:hypothetical protein